MAVLAETVTALQFSFISQLDTKACAADATCSIKATLNSAEIWTYYQRIALTSAILSSLWAPVIYYPLNQWWKWFNMLEQ